MKLYTIRDTKHGFGVAQGLPPILGWPNDDYAKRVLKSSVMRGAKPNELNVFPEDKEIWCIGEFSQDTGVIKPCAPYLVGKAIDYYEGEPNYESNDDADKKAG